MKVTKNFSTNFKNVRKNTKRVRISRLVYFIEEHALKYEVPEVVDAETHVKDLVYSLGQRLADVFMDMEEIHGVKWISQERFESIRSRILTGRFAGTVFYKVCFLRAWKEFWDLQVQIERDELDLKFLRQMMRNLKK